MGSGNFSYLVHTYLHTYVVIRGGSRVDLVLDPPPPTRIFPNIMGFGFGLFFFFRFFLRFFFLRAFFEGAPFLEE